MPTNIPIANASYIPKSTPLTYPLIDDGDSFLGHDFQPIPMNHSFSHPWGYLCNFPLFFLQRLIGKLFRRISIVVMRRPRMMVGGKVESPQDLIDIYRKEATCLFRCFQKLGRLDTDILHAPVFKEFSCFFLKNLLTHRLGILNPFHRFLKVLVLIWSSSTFESGIVDRQYVYICSQTTATTTCFVFLFNDGLSLHHWWD